MINALHPQQHPRTPVRLQGRRAPLTLCALLLGAMVLTACGQQGATSATATTIAPTTVSGATASVATATTEASAVEPTTVEEATATTAVPAVEPTTPVEEATATTEAPTVEPTTSVAEATAAASELEDATPAIVAATNAFLDTLSEAEKATVSFDWTDTAQKQRWSNFPDGAFQRAGLMWGDMNDASRAAWLAVMQATLSTEGYNRVIAEWNADDQLATGDNGGGARFGSAYYYIAILGTPSETDAWQWQWGGHHVTVNATVVGPNIALTPSYIGAEPITYTDANGTTVRPLGDIEDDAFALVNSLDATQQQAAILGNTAIDVVLGPGEDGRTIQAEGLPASQMTAEQQSALMTLIGHYTGLLNDEDAAVRTAEIQATLDETYFAWYGPTTAGDPAYFRITGPTLVIEYSPQGNRGAAAGTTYHVHGIYRDPTNDYGVKYAP